MLTIATSTDLVRDDHCHAKLLRQPLQAAQELAQPVLPGRELTPTNELVPEDNIMNSNVL